MKVGAWLGLACSSVYEVEWRWHPTPVPPHVTFALPVPPAKVCRGLLLMMAPTPVMPTVEGKLLPMHASSGPWVSPFAYLRITALGRKAVTVPHGQLSIIVSTSEAVLFRRSQEILVRFEFQSLCFMQ